MKEGKATQRRIEGEENCQGQTDANDSCAREATGSHAISSY